MDPQSYSMMAKREQDELEKNQEFAQKSASSSDSSNSNLYQATGSGSERSNTERSDWSARKLSLLSSPTWTEALDAPEPRDEDLMRTNVKSSEPREPEQTINRDNDSPSDGIDYLGFG
jgi:hypothetical protein